VTRDDQFGDRLTDADGRAALIRDLGDTMLARGWSSADDVYGLCEGRVRASEPCLVTELARLRAYADPVRKKTYFFLSLMRNFGLWEYRDPQLLGPPADYHEVRGHLRIGTVVVEDRNLQSRLRTRRPATVEEDNAIRACVVTAIETIADELGITPSRAHYMFWNVFRNVCTRDRPQCFRILPDNQLPDRYVPLTHLATTGSGCPFSAVCRSAGQADMLLDPVTDTEYH
jgi:hypothetical protein